MPEAFSFNREFDFVRLDGLRRMTGRPAHEWDFYIIKELIDNALDADEVSWRKDIKQNPRLKIRIEYANNQLFVEVGNRSIFPAALIPKIFATQQYTSRKAFVKELTRGALGNALKTLLGIPYALRNRVANDWIPFQDPLAIICGGVKYLPTYSIDTIQQTIEFECVEKPYKQTDGTILRINLDYFEQEKPRTIAEIKQLAEQYCLCNPNVDFDWEVEVGTDEWAANYVANPNWLNKFRGVAPIQWYSLAAFQDLLGALHREGNTSAENKLSIESIGAYFGDFREDSEGRSNLTKKLLNELGQIDIVAESSENVDAKKLYLTMCNLSPVFDSRQLGLIGKEHIQKTLEQIFLLDGDGEVFYDLDQDMGDDPSTPFVIEVVIAPLQEGPREIYTAINFSPTYDDPFLRRRLWAPIQPDKALLGLGALLDIYGINEETPVMVFFHLICPSVESGEFSKTEINHLPFKQVMGELFHRVLKTFIQAQEEKALQLEKTIFDALAEILDALKDNELCIFEQLIEKLRVRLEREPHFTEWLQAPEASERMKSYLIRYQSQNTKLNQRIARPAEGIIVVPVHPDRYFTFLS